MWSARGPVLIGLIVVVALLAGVVGWGMFTTISGAVIASGQVTIPEHSQVVDHPDGGVIREILVKNGDLVDAGQPVIRLDRTYLEAEREIATAQLFEAQALAVRLQAERDELPAVTFPAALMEQVRNDPEKQSILDGEAALFGARKSAFNAQVLSLQQQSVDLVGQVGAKKQQLKSYDEQIELLDTELTSVRALWEKGLVQESRLLALKRERARLTAVIDELNGSVEASTAQQGLIQLEISRLTAARGEEVEGELHDTSRVVGELTVQVRAIEERLARLVLTAPMAGLVHDLKVNTIGSVLRPADPILYIIPNSGNIGVTARVDPTNIDAVRPDQLAKVKFSAFNARLVPEVSGRVSGISADTLVDERSGASFYRVDLVIEASQLALLGGETLIPGMPVEVFIATEPQSPMAYLLRPFTDYLDRAMRN